jgi:ribonuclease HII
MPDPRSGSGPQRHRWSQVERKLRLAMGPLVAGVDEVGRGPLAGPVVACAIVMPPDQRAIAGVDDSKRLSRDERERLATRIAARALGIGIGAASVREIDRLNIYQATVLAVRRALRRLPVTPDHVLMDGRPIRTLEVPHTAIVGGDGSCYSIACASIVAKVTRDRLMRALALRHPQFRWERNVGYATEAHLQALHATGPTRHHRQSFLPVRQLTLDLAAPSAHAAMGGAAMIDAAIDDAGIDDAGMGDAAVLLLQQQSHDIAPDVLPR